jgi:hypothetical protein
MENKQMGRWKNKTDTPRDGAAALHRKCFTVSEPRAVATGPKLNSLAGNVILKLMAG